MNTNPTPPTTTFDLSSLDAMRPTARTMDYNTRAHLIRALVDAHSADHDTALVSTLNRLLNTHADDADHAAAVGVLFHTTPDNYGDSDGDGAHYLDPATAEVLHADGEIDTDLAHCGDLHELTDLFHREFGRRSPYFHVAVDLRTGTVTTTQGDNSSHDNPDIYTIFDASETTHAWADAFGRWHVRITLTDPGLTADEAAANTDRWHTKARTIIRREIQQREHITNADWTCQVAQTETDQTHGHIRSVTFREVDPDDEPSTPEDPTSIPQS